MLIHVCCILASKSIWLEYIVPPLTVWVQFLLHSIMEIAFCESGPPQLPSELVWSMIHFILLIYFSLQISKCYPKTGASFSKKLGSEEIKIQDDSVYPDTQQGSVDVCAIKSAPGSSVVAVTGVSFWGTPCTHASCFIHQPTGRLELWRVLLKPSSRSVLSAIFMG